jgi:hypothetical protein
VVPHVAEIVDIRAFRDDSFVVHFGGREAAIDARTLAQALLGLTDTIRTINREVNPGFEIDIEVDALGPGSFRARLRTVKRSAGNLFSAKGAEAIILSVLVDQI